MITVAAGYEAGDPNPYTVERVPVTAPVTGRQLGDGEAEGLRIRDGRHSWLVIPEPSGNGCGRRVHRRRTAHYGLGRVMVLDETEPGSRLTVLQW